MFSYGNVLPDKLVLVAPCFGMRTDASVQDVCFAFSTFFEAIRYEPLDTTASTARKFVLQFSLLFTRPAWVSMNLFCIFRVWF